MIVYTHELCSCMTQTYLLYMYAYNMKIKLLLGVFTYKPVEFSAMEDDADADDDPVLDPGKVSATIMHKDFKNKMCLYEYH